MLWLYLSRTLPLWEWKHGRRPLKTCCFYKVQLLQASSGYKDALTPTGERDRVPTAVETSQVSGLFRPDTYTLQRWARSPVRTKPGSSFWGNREEGKDGGKHKVSMACYLSTLKTLEVQWRRAEKRGEEQRNKEADIQEWSGVGVGGGGLQRLATSDKVQGVAKVTEEGDGKEIV